MRHRYRLDRQPAHFRDIAQWKNAQGQIDPQSVLSHIPWLGFIVGAVLYAMLLGITCFSPMLIAWKKQPIGKAFFFSLVVCFRNIGAIVCLGLLLFLLASGGAVAFGALGDLGQILVILWALFVTGLSYSALYPMWRSIFESRFRRFVKDSLHIPGPASAGPFASRLSYRKQKIIWSRNA